MGGHVSEARYSLQAPAYHCLVHPKRIFALNHGYHLRALLQKLYTLVLITSFKTGDEEVFLSIVGLLSCSLSQPFVGTMLSGNATPFLSWWSNDSGLGVFQVVLPLWAEANFHTRRPRLENVNSWCAQVHWHLKVSLQMYLVYILFRRSRLKRHNLPSWEDPFPITQCQGLKSFQKAKGESRKSPQNCIFRKILVWRINPQRFRHHLELQTKCQAFRVG